MENQPLSLMNLLISSKIHVLKRNKLKITLFMPSQCLIVKSTLSFSHSFLRKGYINTEDLKEVFSLLGENVSDDEVNSK